MRWRIILVNGIILLVVAVSAYVTLASSLIDVAANPAERKAAVQRSLRSASDLLALDALRFEAWLALQAERPGMQEVFDAGTAAARSDAATAQSTRILQAADGVSVFVGLAPQLVVIVDASGMTLGRNGSNLMRGENFGAAHPPLMEALKTGRPASDAWTSRQRQEQLLVSYAPVRSLAGQVVGAVILGTALSDARLTRLADQVAGGAVFVGIPGDTELELVGSSAQAAPDLMQLATGPDVNAVAKGSLGRNQDLVAPMGPVFFGATPLVGYGAGARVVILVALPTSTVGAMTSVLWPIFVIALGGFVLIVAGAVMINAYMARPIAELESGILEVINGNASRRFELQHTELGGVAHGINSLMNALTGVAETDEEGHPSMPQAPRDVVDDG